MKFNEYFTLNEDSNWYRYAPEAARIFNEVGWKFLRLSNENSRYVQFLISYIGDGTMNVVIYVGTDRRGSISAHFEDGMVSDISDVDKLAKLVARLKNLDTGALVNLASEINNDTETFRLQ